MYNSNRYDLTLPNPDTNKNSDTYGCEDDLKFCIMLTVDTIIETSLKCDIPEEMLDDFLRRLQARK